MTAPKNLEDLLPLSPMQELMLLHAMTAPQPGALLSQVGYEILGPLSAEPFRRAWEDLVARHPALRTGFLWDGLPRPLQAVRRSVALPFRTVDLAGLPEAEQRRGVEDLRREEAAAPMPLGRAPLMRCALARLGGDRHHFVWTIHHLVVDRWSHGILFADLAELYRARLHGVASALPPVRGFREYIAWLQGRDRESAARFWREELSGLAEPTMLAGTASRAPTTARVTTRLALAPEAAAALHARASRWRATPGAVLLAGIGIAIGRRVGRDDLVCGLTVSGRPPGLAGADEIVGSFVNNVPARLRLDRAQPLADWVRGIQRDQARRLDHEHASPRDIREWAPVPQPRPLSDVLVVLNLGEAPTAALPGVEMRLASASLDAGYPLVLVVGAEGSGLALSLVHDATFGGAGELLAELAEALAAMAAASPDATVGDLVPNVDGRDSASPGDRSLEAQTRAPIATATGTPDVQPAAAERFTAGSLLDLWREVLDRPDVGLDDDFFALGGTSLQALELFVRLERLLGRSMPLSTLFESGSVRAMMTALGAEAGPPGALVRIRSGGDGPPIVGVPGVGGDVVTLAALARAMGPGRPFFGLQSPGLDGRAEPLTTVEAIAEHFVAHLARGVARPFHLVGLCFGAAVAHEMARRLRELGRAPLTLDLVDPATLLRAGASNGGHDRVSFLVHRLESYRSELRDADWNERGRWLAGKARRLAGVVSSAETRTQSQMELHRFRVERANREAIMRYDPRPYRGRATLFLSARQDIPRGEEDPRLEWLRLIEPTPDVVHVAGSDSGDVVSPANVGRFADVLRERHALSADPVGLPASAMP